MRKLEQIFVETIAEDAGPDGMSAFVRHDAIEQVNARVHAVSTLVDSVRRYVGDSEDIEGLPARLAALEDAMASLRTDLHDMGLLLGSLT